MLIGLGKMVKKIIDSALRTLLYTYTTTGTPGTQGGSYYMTNVETTVNGYIYTNFGNELKYSIDNGETWTIVPLPYGYQRKLKIENGNYFLVGGTSNDSLVSTNGSTWTVTSAQLYDIAFYNGKYYAVNQAASGFSISTDGINYTTYAGGNFYKVYKFDNALFITGQDIFATITGDLITGHSITVSSTNTVYYGVEYINGVYVRNYYFGIEYSSNGLTWTNVAVANYTSIMIKANNRLFLYANDNYELYTTTDGINWNSISLPFRSLKIVYLNNEYVLYGYGWSNGNTMAKSSDLSNWTTFSTGVALVQEMVYLEANASYPGRYFAVGVTNTSNYPNAILSTTSLSSMVGNWEEIPDSSYWNPYPLKFANNKYFLSYQQKTFIIDPLKAINYTSLESVVYSNGSGYNDGYIESIVYGPITTTVQSLVTIGGQGDPGSFVESLLPVKLIDIREIVEANVGYPNNNNTAIFKVTVKNTGTNSEYVTMGISYDGGISIDTSNPGQYFEDVLIPAGETVIIPSTDYINTQSNSAGSIFYMVSGTAANVLQFKVYDWSRYL